MSLELPDLDHPGPALAGILGGLAKGIRADIENLSDDVATRIHDIRVSSKKIRSLLKLTRPVLPKDSRRELAAKARQLKEIFSASRDDDVMRQRLAELFPDGEFSAAADALGLQPTGELTDLPTAQATGLADDLCRGLENLDLTDLTLSRLAKNAAGSYREARRMQRLCAKAIDDTAMHDWRKRVKDIFYHAQALAGAKPLKKLVDPLDALADRLGTYHDLALLAVRAAGHATIAERVESEKRRLAAESFDHAKAALARPPGALARKLARALS